MKRGPAMRLLAAAAISVAAHAALLAGSWLTPPEPAPELPPLNVQLQPLAPAAAPRAVEPQRKPPPQRIAAAPSTAPQPDAVIPAVPDPIPAAEAATPAQDPVAVTSAAATVFQPPEPPPLPSFPRKGRINYAATMNGTPIGNTVQSWEFDGTQYTLGSQSESSGLIELIRPHRYYYLSKGTISEQGLRPERFIYTVKRGNRREESQATFDWTQGRVHLGRLPQQDTLALPAGTQDILSFMYQLALRPPPPGRITMPYTKGRQMDTARFDVLPEETVETPLGRLRAVPVIQVHETGRESIGVWLATEYRNLPIRIRFFSRDGEISGEQLVNAIQVSEQ